jgi:hypothetical protein
MAHAFERGEGSTYWRQLNEIEKGVVRFVQKEKAKLDAYIDEHSLLTRQNVPGIKHIRHWWKNPKTGEPYDVSYGRTAKTMPEGMRRTIPTFEAGIKKGLEPASMNIGELVGIEIRNAAVAANTRAMVKSLHNIPAERGTTIQLVKGKTPKPIRMIERWDKLDKQGLTDGYERYSHPALDKAFTFRDGKGTLVRFEGAVGVHESIYPYLRAYLDSPTHGKFMEFQFATKRLKLGLSMFHAVSLAAQEVALHRIPFKNIPRGLKIAKNLNDPYLRILYREGLDFPGKYEDLPVRGKFIKSTKVGAKAVNVAAKPVEWSQRLIFDVIQPGMKTSYAYDVFGRLLKKNAKRYGVDYQKVIEQIESGKITDPKIKKLVDEAGRKSVKMADGHFSHEDVRRAALESTEMMAKLYFSPEARKFWDATLLSKTWQREHILVAKNVMKSLVPDPVLRKMGLEDMALTRGEYLKYAGGALAMVSAVDFFNYMSTKIQDGEGKHLWQNPKGKKFAIRAWWDEPEYTVTDKNGKERTIQGGRAYIRPLKSVYEVAEFASDPRAKLSYKFAPWIGASADFFFGAFNKDKPLYEALADAAIDMGTPISLQQTQSVLRGKKSPQGAVFPFFGMPVSKDKDMSKTTAKRRIQEAIKSRDDGTAREIHKEYNRRNPDDKLLPYEVMKIEYLRYRASRRK